MDVPSTANPVTVNALGDQAHHLLPAAGGEQGLLLVPVLVCIALLLYALMWGAAPASPHRDDAQPSQPAAAERVQR